MYDDNYRHLVIMDRIYNYIKQQHLGINEISQQCGHQATWLCAQYSKGMCLRLPNIIKVAKIINLSVKYILQGGTIEPYKEVTENYKNLIDIYDTYVRNCKKAKYKILGKLKTIMYFYKKGMTTSFNISTLLNYADFFKVDVYHLCIKEKKNG